MEGVQEVASMLSRAGSFYYKNLSVDGMTIARKLTQLYSNCRVFEQLKAAGELALSGGYFNDFGIVVQFSDKDIDYFGVKEALQERPVKNELTIKSHVALANQDNRLLTELDREARLESILSFPYLSDGGSDMAVASRDSLQYGLYIDKDTFVSSINAEDGSLLFNGIDFEAHFGVILFKTNPYVLFPKGKFLAASVTRRRRNLLSFVLGVDEVYGPIDRIMEYYRVAQSPKTFYYAAAQAIGMCVVPEDCIVTSVEPLHKGYAYITTIGKLDAPYNHTPYSKGDAITRNTVIGGNELFDIVLPGESLPSGLGSVSLDYLLPVSGLSAPNSTISISSGGVFSPAFEGSASAKAKYLEFVKEQNGGSLPASSVGSTNAVNYVRNTMAPRRCIILRINESRMYSDMQLRLEHFIERELPIGVVLLKENMVRDF